MSLKKKVAHSALWQLLGGGWLSVVRLAASFVLARTLSPEDYGVFGVAILMRVFIERLGSVGGLSNGLIAQKNTRDIDICTCFWSMTLVRIILFVFTILIAPVGGWFFNDARVVDVVRVISFTFLFSIFGGISATLLSKRLRFKELNIVHGAFALLESTLSVVLALNTDLGYWVLVIGAILNAFLTQMTFFLIARWWPKFKFDFESFRYLYRYAINGLGFNIADYLKQNLDYLLVGRLLGTTSLGLYEFAYRIPHMVQDHISKPVGDVVLPALSKVQDDNKQLAQGYIQSIKYVCFISFPILFGLVAVADVAVPLLWGEQWVPVITPLRLLCVCAALRLFLQPLSALYICKDRPDIPFKISVIELIWTIVIVGYFASGFGLFGVALGMTLSVVPSYYFLSHAFKMINSKVYYLAIEIWSSFFCSSVCMLAAFSVSQSLQAAQYQLYFVLPISVATGALVYISAFYVFFKSEYVSFVSQLLKITNKWKVKK